MVPGPAVPKGIRLRELDAVALRQRSLFTYEQARRAGYSASAIQRKLASGEWIPLYPKVLRPAAALLTHKTRVMGGVLWGGGTSVASHRSAAVLWDLFGAWGDDVEITTMRRQSVDGIRVHHSSRPIPRADVDGIPVTPVDRTVLDLSSIAPLGKVAAVMDDALRRELTNVDALEKRLASEARSGRPGIAVFRLLVEERSGRAITDSTLEDMFADLARKQGWSCVHHFIFRTGSGFVAEMDFAFLREMIDVEVDGYDPHRTLDKFERDRERDSQLQLHGWIVLRFTWKQLKERPDWVVARVEEALRLRQGALR